MKLKRGFARLHVRVASNMKAVEMAPGSKPVCYPIQTRPSGGVMRTPGIE
jgi:hypothetical protein